MTFSSIGIEIIGFDLDQTLYPRSTEVDRMIQKYIYEKIAGHRNIPIDEASRLFRELYKDGNGLSGRNTLEKLGIPNGASVVQEALERADIASILSPNPQTLLLLTSLKEKYKNIDLITGSNKNQTDKKLKTLNLENIFLHFITPETASKSDGSAFDYWLSIYPEKKPESFLYIGDKIATDYTPAQERGIKTILVNIEKQNQTVTSPQLSSLYEIQPLLL